MPSETSAFTINPPDYKEAIARGKDCYIQINRLGPEQEGEIRKIIRRYLQKFDILYTNDVMMTILKELINNAVKANLKRLYFKLKSLDINKENEYDLGMANFKNDVFIGDTEKFFSLLTKTKLVVRIIFKIMDDHLKIQVVNNMPIIDKEYKKINARIDRAYQIEDISEVFEEAMDDTEGAGLGLIMSLMLFKNIATERNSFKVEKREKLTVVSMEIPFEIIDFNAHTKITSEILKEIEDIPTFPENILEIQRLCSAPDSTIKSISDRIKVDPGLTANILRLANSAGYITSNQIDDIESAVKIIGLKGTSALVLASGVKDLLGARYKKLEEIWKNSLRAAFYAQKIAVQVNRSKLSEHVYLAAILADIGKIVLTSIAPDLEKRILQIMNEKGIIASQLVEEVSIGMSHGTLGGKILQKWKFSEALIKTIEYHHRPYLAPEKYRELVYIIYLAHSIMEVEDQHAKYANIDDEVLEYFNLNDEQSLKILHNVLFETYKKKMGIE